MPLSTSSSDRSSAVVQVTGLRWACLLGAALLCTLAVIAALELALAGRGYAPTVVDSEARWLQQRQRAASLGPRAVVLLGASRIQLDVDLKVLREHLQLEPVQLAIDGSGVLPVLRGVAQDPAIKGLVLVDYYESNYAQPSALDAANRYQRLYAAQQRHGWNAAVLEAELADALHSRLRAYSDGAQPWQSLLLRALGPTASPQYLVTLPDRSRLADYSKVAMPAFALERAIRNLGADTPVPGGNGDAARAAFLRAAIPGLQAVDPGPFVAELTEVQTLVDAIRTRGGEVVFLRLPVTGYVREIDRRRFPRALFWDVFTARIDAPAIDFEDSPALAQYSCPDGSHLDYRDRARFTLQLAAEINARRGQGKAITAAPP